MNQCFVALLAILNFMVVGDLAFAQDSGPFEERLTYNMNYLGLSSAQAEFLLMQSDSITDSPTIRFIAKVQTRGISDTIFRICNRYESLIDAKSGLPLIVRKEIDQPNIRHSLEIRFNQTVGLATSSQGDSWSISPNCYDLFSMLCALRRMNFEDGDSLEFVLDVESQLWQISGHVEKYKTLKTKLGKLPATYFNFKFHSSAPPRRRKWKTDLLTNRIGKEGAPLEIWLGNDPERIPLKLRFGEGFLAVEMNILCHKMITTF